MTQERTRILIAGGGYVGMYTALRLQKKLHRGEAEITVIDPQPHMTYQPFLPEAAAGSIEPRHVVVPLRRVLRKCQVLTGRVSDRTALTIGLLTTAVGLGVPALLANLTGLLVAAVLIGLGTAAVTPVAFAALAATSPAERLGQTMGAAEIGRELGDAGGPLVIGALGAAISLATGFLGLGVLVALAGALAGAARIGTHHP